jgi:hypothetical protein
MEERRGE